ncbi:anti-sigma regulatory factor [Noviherbaspirillum sp. ST9]|uniref:anti-sigma regulatory factor n=1 Tax=Noviherbaspirillum sp. ST9 TaxID=3401606 RepID=UPI003B58AE5B
MDEDDVTLLLKSEVDVLRARKEGQRLARELGMTAIDSVKVATAVSEIASNALFHAREGSVNLRMLCSGNRRGLSVTVADRGPGIADLEQAMRDGFSTRNSLGIGLGAARRMMDDFEVNTEIGRGTTVTMAKWKD